MLNSNIFVASCSVSLRWLVCGFLVGPPYHTKSKEGLVESNKDIESGTMDETKSQEIESLKKENLRLRQQMMEMYRTWASGLPPPPFPTFDPANTLSLPPKSQSQFSTVIDAPQHASESVPRQIHLNTSTTLSLAPQYKSTTFIAPHTVYAFVAQPSTKTSTLDINPTIVLPQSTSKSTFNTFGNHCYTLEPTVKLSRSPKFLTKKPSMLEELEKVVGKVKSVENYMKNSPGLIGYEDTSKFGEPDGQNDSVKHLGRHCNQPRKTKGKKKENAPIVIPGLKQSLRGPTHQYCRLQSRAYILDPYNHLKQVSSEFRDMITPLLGYTPDPHSRSFYPNVRCAFHSDVQDHSIEDCRALKSKIEKINQLWCKTLTVRKALVMLICKPVAKMSG
ncbi:hypothetical protein P3S68_029902 [Capsicum galapagoense]